MDAPLVILCYHRVLPEAQKTGDGRPYFVRGTAVTQDRFAAQVRSLARHFEILPESEVLAALDGRRSLRRPSCWITFDDGYRDILDHAAPVLGSSRLPATVFVTSAVIEERGRSLPADRWYAVLHRATRRRGILGSGESEWRFDLDRTQDYERLVDGPERRRYLRAEPREQAMLLCHLSDALGVGDSGTGDLYMQRDDLRRLVAQGLSVGGHGRTHRILSGLDEADAASEVRDPLRFLEELGLSPRTFAYPDGACSPQVADLTRAAGWSSGLALGNRQVAAGDDRFLLPRFLPSDDAQWVEKALLPALGRTVLPSGHGLATPV